jgi:hypothetical protein
MLSFLILSIVLFLFKNRRFGHWILSPSSGKRLLSWAQSIQLVHKQENSTLDNIKKITVLTYHSHKLLHLI